MMIVVIAVVAIIAAGTPVLFYRLRLSKAAAARDRVRTLWWRIKLHLRPGPGYTSTLDMLSRWSRTRAALGHGSRGRPGSTRMDRLTGRVTQYAVSLGRAHWFKRVYGSLEDQTLVCSVPRTGKTGYLGARILDHPGAVLTTTTRADLYTLTAGPRGLLGPVYVFNPQGIGDVKSTFRWDIAGGCQDPEVACRRAAALTGKRYEGAGDMAFWQAKASVALAALIHAAALDGRTIEDVFRWACRDGDKQAEDILRRQPEPGPLLSTILEIRADTRMAQSVRGTMMVSLAWVAVPDLAEAGTPGPGAAFDVGRFVRSNSTLYMIGSGEDSPVAALFRTLAEHIHYGAGLIGSRTPAGRLDPPLLFALDEVTQICPVPLDKWVADSGGKGIGVVAVCHGRSQLVERWGHAGAATIWDCSGVKILLGGITDHETLERVSRLYGTIPVVSRDGQHRDVPIVPPELVNQLPDGRALVLRRNCRALVVTLEKAWKRRRVPVPAPLVGAPARVLPATVELPVADPQLVTPGNGGGNGNGHGPHGVANG